MPRTCHHKYMSQASWRASANLSRSCPLVAVNDIATAFEVGMQRTAQELGGHLEHAAQIS